MLRSALLPLSAVVALVALAACDSGDSVDPPGPADVAGIYDVAEFRFRPDAAALAPVNLLDTLVAADTKLYILDGGDAFLLYRFRGGAARVLLGEAEVRRQQVRLSFESDTEQARERLLLPGEPTDNLDFDREGSTLVAMASTRANLAAYDSDRYGGFNDVPGTLVLRLVLPDAGG